MTHLGYLLVGWGVSLGAGLIYATRLLVRGKKLSAKVPANRRRWMTSNDSESQAAHPASAANPTSATSTASATSATSTASTTKETSP